MGDLKKINNDTQFLSLIHHPNLLGELGKPFANKIYLIDVVDAGTTHIENIQDLEPKLKCDTKVYFYREPANEVDPFAIVIKNEAGEKYGYIPRKQNEILARLLDGGKLLYGIVQSKEFVGNWLKITLKVFLDD